MLRFPLSTVSTVLCLSYVKPLIVSSAARRLKHVGHVSTGILESMVIPIFRVLPLLLLWVQRGAGYSQQPRTNHAAATPHVHLDGASKNLALWRKSLVPTTALMLEFANLPTIMANRFRHAVPTILFAMQRACVLQEDSVEIAQFLG